MLSVSHKPTAVLAMVLVTLGVVGPASGTLYRIVFTGAQPLTQGLRVVQGPGVAGRVVTAGNRPCWSTHRRRGQYLIAVEVPALTQAPRPAPIRVGVSYLDRGVGQWALVYDAYQGMAISRQHGPVVQKRNSGRWREAEFTLPDFTGTWLAVDSFGAMVDEDDEYIAEIVVRPGGPGMVAPPVLAAGEKHVLQATYWNPDYLPRAWSIALRASAGAVQELVLAGPQASDFEYTAPLSPGWVTLEAQVDEARAAQRMLIWRGHSPLQTESTLINPSGTPDDWMYWPFAAQVSLKAVSDEDGSVTTLAFNFTGDYWPGYVDLTRRTFLRGLPVRLHAQVRGNSGGARLQGILEDASGQRFCYDWGPVRAVRWTRLDGSLQGPTRYWGGVADGVPRFPMYFLSLRMAQGPEGSAVAGQISLREVFVESLAPSP